MTLNFILLLFLIILVVLFTVLMILFLRKDQHLAEMKGKYEHLLEVESKQLEMNKQKDDYVAMMVHELRSPLSVIKGSADLVMREEEHLSPDQKSTMLTQIKQSAADLLAIVNDILDVSKIESGRFTIKKMPGDLNQVLEDEANYYMTLALEKDIKVKTSLDTSIPELQFDTDRLKHIMNNLLSNALKFTPKGGNVLIKSFLEDDGYVHVEVMDNGNGISDQMKDKLFNKFVQADNRSNTDQKGTGLGLFITKGIVEAHGGSIWVEDNEPKGAKFIFTIPLGS